MSLYKRRIAGVMLPKNAEEIKKIETEMVENRNDV
jgi:hypothetical protein